MIDSKRLAVSLLGSVRAWVEPAFKSIGERIDSLEVRISSIPAGPQGERGQDGISGKDGTPGPQGERGQDGVNGKDAEPIHLDTIARLVSDSTRLAVKDIPLPRDGKDGAHGRDADPVLIEKLVQANITSAIAALPVPKDGEPGRDGRDADPDFIRAQIMAIVESIPTPKDGADGLPGSNGADADPALIADAVAGAVASIEQSFAEMADELLHGFEDAASAAPNLPSVSVNVNASGMHGARARLMAEGPSIADKLAERLEATLRMPVKPVFDAQGRLLYAQRVTPAEVE